MTILMQATRQLVLDGSNYSAGSGFYVEESRALELESKGLATRYRPPMLAKAKPAHANKMMFAAPENK